MPHDEAQLQHGVHRTLLSGLVISAGLLVAGLLAMLAQGQQEATRHESIAALVRDASRLDGSALTTLGLLVLMVTPIVRVLVLLVGWAARRDWHFATVAFVVLVLLVISLSLGVG